MSRSTHHANKSRRRRPGTIRRFRLEPLEARRLLAVVSGQVIFDTNANGVVDSGESGAADVAVVLRDTAGSVVSGPVTTDGTGAYAFNNVADGNYQVAIDFAAGTDQLQSFPGRLTNPDRLGAFLDAFDSPLSPLVDDATPIGLTWVGSELYTANKAGSDGSSVDKSIFSWDGTSWHEEFTAAGTESVYDLAYDGTDLWAADYTGNQIVQYDLADNQLASYTANTVDGTARLRGITWDGSHFWVIEQKNNADGTALEQRLQKWSLDSSTGSATVLESLDLDVESPVGLQYNQGTLWLASISTNSIYAIDVAASIGGSAVVAKQFAAPAENENFPTGLAIKDDSLFIAQYSDNRVLQIDLGSPQTRVVTVTGSDVTVADFGVSAYGQVSGTVYEDLNQDGTQQTTEAGLEGWRAYVDINGNSQLDSFESLMQSDANGQFSFDQVLPGSATVRLQQRSPGWTLSDAKQSETVTVLARSVSDVRFGALQTGFGPVGPETLINQTVDGVQGGVRQSGVAINTNGYSAVAFESLVTTNRGDVFLRILDADGNPVTGEIVVDSATRGDQWKPTVTNVEGTGQFVVGWTVGAKPDRQGYIRIYSEQGVAQTAPIAITAKNAETSIVEIDTNAQGEMLVLYKEISEVKGPSTADNDVIHAQRFDAAGNAMGSAIEVADPTTSPTQSSATLAEGGSFVVVWRQTGSEMLAQRYDVSGKATGNQITVQNGDNVWTARVASDQNENFAIGWTEGSSPYSVKLNYYNASGVQQGSTFEVTPSTASTNELGLAMTNQGEIALSWNEQSPEFSSEVLAQRLRFDDFDGQLVALDASPYVVNSTSSGNQERSDVAFGPEGQMSVVWNGNGLGDDQGVFLQRYAEQKISLSHDVAVTGLTAPSSVIESDTSSIDVLIENQGTSDETFDVVLTSDNGTPSDTDDDFTIASWIGVLLASGSSDTLTATWDTIGVSPGDHTLTAEAILSTDQDTADNTATATVTVEEERHDVAVIALTAPNPVVEGDVVSIDTTVENQGNRAETFDVTLVSDNGTADTADDIVIATWIGVALDANASQVLITSWDTTGVNVADHTLTATATAVTDETDTLDNTLSATVTVESAPSGSTSNMYVGDIRFESKSRGKHFTDYRVVVEIRHDSNANGVGEVDDDALKGVTVTVVFNGVTYTGKTDAEGIFRTEWVKNLDTGDHYANVVDLALTGYNWDPLVLDLEDDSDEIYGPDALLTI